MKVNRGGGALRPDAVGNHARRAALRAGLRHRPLRQMAPRRHRGPLSHQPGLRRMVRHSQLDLRKPVDVVRPASIRRSRRCRTSWKAARARRRTQRRSLRPEDAPADRHRDHPADDRLHASETRRPASRSIAYVPFTLVHYPTLPHPDFAGKTGYGDFADSLAEMDHHVGQILDAVKDARHRGQHHRRLHQRQRPGGDAALARLGRARGRARTSRRWKARCACRSSSAGRARSRPGRVSNEIVHEVDMFTTLARIAGAAVPEGPHHRRRGSDRFLSRQAGEIEPRGVPLLRRRTCCTP